MCTTAKTLRCDMCGKPLKGVRYTIEVLLRPGRPLVVGPECFRKEKKARKEMLARHTPEQIEALRAKIAAL
jgi:ribosome-binding protein aMBF1 (putative translation factor)